MTRVGQVLGAHGTDGAVKVLSLTDFDDRFQRGARLMLEGDERTVEWSRAAGGELVVKLKGIDDRTMAKHIRGRYLEVGEEAARPAAEGRFYHHQLVGLSVATAGGRPLGVIEEILERPAKRRWWPWTWTRSASRSPTGSSRSMKHEVRRHHDLPRHVRSRVRARSRRPGRRARGHRASHPRPARLHARPSPPGRRRAVRRRTGHGDEARAGVRGGRERDAQQPRAGDPARALG